MGSVAFSRPDHAANVTSRNTVAGKPIVSRAVQLVLAARSASSGTNDRTAFTAARPESSAHNIPIQKKNHAMVSHQNPTSSARRMTAISLKWANHGVQ